MAVVLTHSSLLACRPMRRAQRMPWRPSSARTAESLVAFRLSISTTITPIVRVSSHAKLVFEQRGVKKGGVALDMLSTHSCIHLFRLHGAIFRLFRISYLATKYPTIITFANFRDICNGPNMRLASGMTHSATPNHKTGGLSLRSLSDV